MNFRFYIVEGDVSCCWILLNFLKFDNANTRGNCDPGYDRPAPYNIKIDIESIVSFLNFIVMNQIKAVFNEKTIRVYQAYSDEIADAVLRDGHFLVSSFKMNRMTWIKPSFLWMMYRAGWGFKDEHQKRILAIDICREGFEWALAHSCPSQVPKNMNRNDWMALKNTSPVRIQWDPERDLLLGALPSRTIQIGLSGKAVELYVNEWVKEVNEVTMLGHEIFNLIKLNNVDAAQKLLPKEMLYQ
jgi:hypothetical protein